MPATDKTPIIAKTPSISIIDRPSWFAPLPPVILGLVPRILLHQGRCNPSPLLAPSLRGVQRRSNLEHKLETSYLSPHPAGCGRRVSTTLLLKATHIDIACAMTLWILRHGTSSREYRRRMTLKLVLEKRGNVPPSSFVLNALLPKVSFFLPNPVKTC